MQRLPVLGAVLVVVAACQDATSPNPIAAPPATVNAARGAAGKDYIVVLRDDVSDPDIKGNAFVKAHGGSLKHVYKKALKGFAVANLSDGAVAALRATDGVAYVEADQIMSADDAQLNPPSWGLDRIDQRALPLDKSFTYPNAGGGVTAYIIDTGINGGSSDFVGRVRPGKDYIDYDDNPADCHGHGTHVAGTVAGTAYGIAKAANIVAVRVLNCQGSGSNSGVIAGVDWVAANAAKPAVANRSLGGGYSSALNAAVARAVDAGVTFAVAAGNSNANACSYSPSSEPKALTVGATTSSDAKASYSNYGSCVDIQAPGSSITSDWIGSATATNTISGTSMASPHVAGAAALVLGTSGNGSLTPAQVATQLVGNATSGVVSGLPSGTVNKLLYVGAASQPPVEPPSGTPTVSVSKSCNGLDCTFTANVSNATAPVTYAWDFSDETTNRTAPSFSRNFAARTSYTFTLTVMAANGTVGPINGTVTCNPKKCQ
jgi:subtilisin family serine protease